MHPVEQIMTRPEVMTVAATVIVAVLGTVGAFAAYAKQWIESKIKPIAKDVAAAKDQVTNHNESNMRDDISRALTLIEKLAVQMDGVAEIQRSQGHQLGEIKDQQILESKDRQSLDIRVQALSEAADKSHNSLWDAVREGKENE